MKFILGSILAGLLMLGSVGHAAELENVWVSELQNHLGEGNFCSSGEGTYSGIVQILLLVEIAGGLELKNYPFVIRGGSANTARACHTLFTITQQPWPGMTDFWNRDLPLGGRVLEKLNYVRDSLGRNVVKSFTYLGVRYDVE